MGKTNRETNLSMLCFSVRVLFGSTWGVDMDTREEKEHIFTPPYAIQQGGGVPIMNCFLIQHVEHYSTF